MLAWLGWVVWMKAPDLRAGGNFDVAYRQVDDFSSNTYTSTPDFDASPPGPFRPIIKPLGSLTDE
jgi:hypothetical protein